MINILIIVISLLLIGVVIIQNSKGGGLDANFSSQQNLLGVKKSTEVIEKATWSLIATLVLVCIISTKMSVGKPVSASSSSASDAAKAGTEQNSSDFSSEQDIQLNLNPVEEPSEENNQP